MTPTERERKIARERKVKREILRGREKKETCIREKEEYIERKRDEKEKERERDRERGKDKRNLEKDHQRF